MTLRLPRALALAAAFALPAPLWAQTDQGDAPAPAAEPAQADIADVVATVDGVDITMGEIILMRANLPDQYQSLPDDQLYEALVQQAINQVLLARRGEASGAADAPLAKLRADLDRRNYLAESGLRAIVRAATSDEALRPLYEERYAAAEPVQEVRASHILVAEKELADTLRAEIVGGAAFADVAAEHGTDGTRTRGGDLGWFTRDRMVPPFAEAAFAAPEGEVTEPVQTQFGWHLILVTGKRDQPIPPFEQVRADLARAAASEAADAAVEAARGDAEITRPETPPAAGGIRRDDLLTP
ncbi:MAG: peptidylprolyl isomerase [Pseudomonadota bacterium]